MCVISLSDDFLIRDFTHFVFFFSFSHPEFYSFTRQVASMSLQLANRDTNTCTDSHRHEHRLRRRQRHTHTHPGNPTLSKFDAIEGSYSLCCLVRITEDHERVPEPLACRSGGDGGGGGEGKEEEVLVGGGDLRTDDALMLCAHFLCGCVGHCALYHSFPLGVTELRPCSLAPLFARAF